MMHFGWKASACFLNKLLTDLPKQWNATTCYYLLSHYAVMKQMERVETALIGQKQRICWGLIIGQQGRTGPLQKVYYKLIGILQTTSAAVFANMSHFKNTSLQAILCMCANCTSLMSRCFQENNTSPTSITMRQSMIRKHAERDISLKQTCSLLSWKIHIRYLGSQSNVRQTSSNLIRMHCTLRLQLHTF